MLKANRNLFVLLNKGKFGAESRLFEKLRQAIGIAKNQKHYHAT